MRFHDQRVSGNPSAGEPAGAMATRPRYQPLVVVVAALAAGILLDRYGLPGLLVPAETTSQRILAPGWPAVWCYLAAGCLFLWWVAWRRWRNAPAACLLLAAVALTGAAWHHLCWDVFSWREIARYARTDSQPACVEVVAQSAPQSVPAPRPTALRAIPAGPRSRLDVRLVAIRGGTSWQTAAGQCQLMIHEPLTEVWAGDRLQVFGQLRRLGPPLNPGEFDYAAHVRADRRLVSLRCEWPDCVTLIDRPGGGSIVRALDAVRACGRRLIERYIGPEQAGLASAILLGSRVGLPTEETESYFLTGTIHVLVVSGLHVGILALGLFGIMRLGWVPYRAGLAVVIGVVVAYALVADARPPVVRAAVLIVLVCVAAWTGRRAVSFNSLAAAGLVILVLNPCDLFRTGPQLSFLCVAILISNHRYLAQRIRFSQDPLDQLIAASRPWLERSGKWLCRWCCWLFVTTGFVWLLSLPLVMYQFHIATPVALLISPVVWVLVMPALWFGFATLFFGWWLPPLAAVFGKLCDTMLAGLEWTVHGAAAVPGGHVWTPGPAGWWVLGFYAGLLIVMFWGRRLMSARWQLALLCAWIVVGVTPPLVAAWTRDRLDCSFVAMGHGTCVVLQTPSGRTLVYDAGSLGSPQYATQSVAAYLWHRGITRIDALVLSHADVDHYNAVPGLLERFPVDAIHVSPTMFRSMDGAEHGRGPAELLAAIRRAGVPLREIWSGDSLRIDSEVVARVLHPPRFGVFGSDNANSITLAVEYQGSRILLPGDLESPGLEDVMAELPYDCDVLLAPHHGSRRSDPPGFAAWSKPEWVVISGGGSADPSVARTYQESGARVLNTGRDGAVLFSAEGGLVSAASWRPAVRSSADRRPSE